MKSLNKEALKEIVQNAVTEFPNSVVADLLNDFDIEVVVKFILIYSGQHIRVPSVKYIWMKFRNKIIRETLDELDNKKRRALLAARFSISDHTVQKIYSNEKRKRFKEAEESEKGKRSMEKSVARLINRNLPTTVEEVCELKAVYRKK